MRKDIETMSRKVASQTDWLRRQWERRENALGDEHMYATNMDGVVGASSRLIETQTEMIDLLKTVCDVYDESVQEAIADLDTIDPITALSRLYTLRNALHQKIGESMDGNRS